MSALIRTTNFFQSDLTHRIDQVIKSSKPTRDTALTVDAIAKQVLNGQDLDYKSLQPVKSHLLDLVSRNLLSSLKMTDSFDFPTYWFFIDKPHQTAYWERK